MSIRNHLTAFAVLALLASGCSDDVARSSVRKLKKENGRLTDKLRALESQIASLKRIGSKVREVEADVEDVTASVSSTRTQVQKLEDSLAKLKAVDALAGDLQKLRDEIENRLVAVDSDLKQVKAAQSEARIAAGSATVASAAPKSLGKLRSQVQSSSRRINELDAKIKKLEGKKSGGGSVNEDALRKLVSDEMEKMRQGWRQRRGGGEDGGGRRRRGNRGNRDGGNDMNH